MRSRVKGFTLVEMIVAFVLLMIVISASGYVLFSVTDIFSRQTETKIAQTIGNGVTDLLESKLKYATNLKFSDTPIEDEEKDAYDEVIFIKNGKVCFIDTDNFSGYDESYDIYGEEYYNGSGVQVKLYPHDNSLADLTVNVYKMDKDGNYEELPEFTKTVTVKMLNVSGGTGTVNSDMDKEYASEKNKPLYISLKM